MSLTPEQMGDVAISAESPHFLLAHDLEDVLTQGPVLFVEAQGGKLQTITGHSGL